MEDEMYIILINNPFSFDFHKIAKDKKELQKIIDEYRFRIVKIYKIEKEISPEINID
jgi:hypothetical protein